MKNKLLTKCFNFKPNLTLMEDIFFFFFFFFFLSVFSPSWNNKIQVLSAQVLYYQGFLPPTLLIKAQECSVAFLHLFALRHCYHFCVDDGQIFIVSEVSEF